MMKVLISAGMAFLMCGSAVAQSMCWTNAPDCSGTWRVNNTSSDNRCYAIFWSGDNGTKNFCLGPGEGAQEQVRTGDQYCVEVNFTPNPHTCNRQFMSAFR